MTDTVLWMIFAADVEGELRGWMWQMDVESMETTGTAQTTVIEADGKTGGMESTDVRSVDSAESVQSMGNMESMDLIERAESMGRAESAESMGPAGNAESVDVIPRNLIQTQKEQRGSMPD